MSEAVRQSREAEPAFNQVLAVFAHYGFRKASMTELAEAAGVSRQTLYNRFTNKDAVLDWAVAGYMDEQISRLLDVLNDATVPINQRLVEVYCIRVGEIVPLMHSSPHGFEMLELGIESMRRREGDPDAAIDAEIARAVEREVSSIGTQAAALTFALTMAAKGLLLKTETTDAFRAGMTRVVDVVLRTEAT